ncbi:putative Poly polymerase catalytic domain-containing protein [Seiridium cardinale]|uniref:Poly [ADP-ribose] polymerase n=1 Tax=Seiridium cardinale TaxID=138064 RepID=A0ABR2XUR5_9PEZI
MAQTRKRGTRGGAKANGTKKQKTAKGTKPTQPQIPIDEGFDEGGNVCVHIDDDGTSWDASLNLSNVSGNNNKLYMLQLLVDDKSDTYYTHARWGRVGETGQIKTVDFSALEEAKKEYEKRFKSKTGLAWEKRTDEPKMNKYTFVQRAYEDDVDDGDDAAALNDDVKQAKSQLDMPTQRLMELIFNENHFNSVLEEIGYNADKLPLGKLGKATLKKGFEELKELASLIKHPSLAQNKYSRDRDEVIEEWTNKYYSTIPHAFGRNRPPMIDNDDILRKEVAMLDTLTDMEVANTIMRANDKAKDGSSVNLLDSRFKELGMKEFAALEHKSKEYKQLSEYLINSSAAGHGLRYRLQDIFRIERPGEHDRFEKSTKTVKDSNRLLLWHGSRTTNFGGILSQGLRIAPPEAPANGYAFGKGVYLADLSSKSANYCVSSLSGGVGLLLLVEAELSNPLYEIDSGEFDADEKAKKHNCIATKGVGKLGYMKWKDAGSVNPALKGVKMPDGKPENNPNHQGGYLQYNEYISYDVQHLKLRYLFKVAM